ncbi:MAG: AI-2E family transporter [candidate division Zixibacteria bacterium]|nr:AI-2E family transporter [candidate division Zixibacteria bacterium]
MQSFYDNSDVLTGLVRTMDAERILKIVALFLGLIVAAIIVVALRQLQSVMLPLMVALLLSFLLGPFVELLTQRKVPLWAAMIVMVIIVFSVIYLVGLLIYSSSNSFIEEFPKYEARVTVMVQDALTYFEIPHSDVKEYVDQLDWKQAMSDIRIQSVISSTLGTFFGFLSKTIMVILLLLFIIPGRRKMGSKLERIFQNDHRRIKKAQTALDVINTQVQLYLIAKTAVSLATGILATIVLMILGVDFAIMWGFFTFILNFIPTVGSIIATIPPILIAFIQFGFGGELILTVILLTTIQIIMGNMVEPRIMGKQLNLSPLIVILALIFWGWLWGIPGMILAVPLASAFKLVCENINTLKPVAALMEGG